MLSCAFFVSPASMSALACIISAFVLRFPLGFLLPLFWIGNARSNIFLSSSVGDTQILGTFSNCNTPGSNLTTIPPQRPARDSITNKPSFSIRCKVRVIVLLVLPTMFASVERVLLTIANPSKISTNSASASNMFSDAFVNLLCAVHSINNPSSFFFLVYVLFLLL